MKMRVGLGFIGLLFQLLLPGQGRGWGRLHAVPQHHFGMSGGKGHGEALSIPSVLLHPDRWPGKAQDRKP